jgi:hypothetical protein
MSARVRFVCADHSCKLQPFRCAQQSQHRYFTSVQADIYVLNMICKYMRTCVTGEQS